MKPGSRLGKDPLSRQAGTGADHALRNILEPSPAPAPMRPGEALSQVGERFAKALSRLISLAARADLLPEGGPQDRTMLLLIRLIESLRLHPDRELVDMAAYLNGVSGPWTLVFAEHISPAPLGAALGLALGLAALNQGLRASQHREPGALTLRLMENAPHSPSLRLYGAPEAFPTPMDQICGPPGADLKTLARRGLLSVRLLSSANAREVRLDAATSL